MKQWPNIYGACTSCLKGILLNTFCYIHTSTLFISSWKFTAMLARKTPCLQSLPWKIQEVYRGFLHVWTGLWYIDHSRFWTLTAFMTFQLVYINCYYQTVLGGQRCPCSLRPPPLLPEWMWWCRVGQLPWLFQISRPVLPPWADLIACVTSEIRSAPAGSERGRTSAGLARREGRGREVERTLCSLKPHLQELYRQQ